MLIEAYCLLFVGRGLFRFGNERTFLIKTCCFESANSALKSSVPVFL